MLDPDPDPDWMNPDPQHCRKVLKSLTQIRYDLAGRIWIRNDLAVEIWI